MLSATKRSKACKIEGFSSTNFPPRPERLTSPLRSASCNSVRTWVRDTPNRAPFALSYGARDVTDARTELGVRTDKSFAMPDGILTLRGRAAWAVEELAGNRFLWLAVGVC